MESQILDITSNGRFVPYLIDPAVLLSNKAVTSATSVRVDNALKIDIKAIFPIIQFHVSGLTVDDIVEIDKIDFYYNPSDAGAFTNKLADLTISATSIYKENLQARSFTSGYLDAFDQVKISNVSGSVIKIFDFKVAYNDLGAKVTNYTKGQALSFYAVPYFKFSRVAGSSGTANITINSVSGMYPTINGGVAKKAYSLPITSIA